jgi:SAM-dependent methyltransferase
MEDVLSSYYEKAFLTAGEGGSIYTPMTVFEMAGHERKGYLLSQLDMPDLSQSTVVDYGVGSWGFGCVFPKLKKCKVAIGVDISQFAVDCSRKISENDPELSGARLEFITSSGYDIKLHDESADVVFAGECIEHIEDTDAFLSEIYRVLKPNGIAIFTTPNERPGIYRQRNLKWAMGFEHVALMDSETVLSRISRHFEIVNKKGYTSTIDPMVDLFIRDQVYANELARVSENDFHNASGLIVQARKPQHAVSTSQEKRVRHHIVESKSIEAYPDSAELSLYEEATGRMATGEKGYLNIHVPENAIRCNIILWSHPWSGVAQIEAGKTIKEVDLYSHVSGCARVIVESYELEGCRSIKVRATGNKRAESQGSQVIIFRAVFAVGDGGL